MTLDADAHRDDLQDLDDAQRDAFREALAALDRAETEGEPMALCQALAQVGRCYRELQAWGPADAYLQRALKLALSLESADACVELLCESAELSACLADELQTDAREAHALRDRARDQAYEAARMARHAADPQWEVTVLLRISALLDRLGDRDDAIALQCRALGLMGGEPETAQRAPGALM